MHDDCQSKIAVVTDAIFTRSRWDGTLGSERLWNLEMHCSMSASPIRMWGYSASRHSSFKKGAWPRGNIGCLLTAIGLRSFFYLQITIWSYSSSLHSKLLAELQKRLYLLKLYYYKSPARTHSHSIIVSSFLKK